MAFQLFNESEKFIPFVVIKWSAKRRIFRLAVHLVAVEDTPDLYNTHGKYGMC